MTWARKGASCASACSFHLEGGEVSIFEKRSEKESKHLPLDVDPEDGDVGAEAAGVHLRQLVVELVGHHVGAIEGHGEDAGMDEEGHGGLGREVGED